MDGFCFRLVDSRWLTVQQVYFIHVWSKLSPKQWPVAVIHQLLLMSWDMWTCQNGMVHAPSGPLDLQVHHELIITIDNQWDEGYADLNKSDRYLFTACTKKEIYELNLHQKKQWLQDVEQAREQDDDLENQPIPITQLHNYMAKWLDSVQLHGDKI